jgi:hypothetical protein
MDNKDNSLNAKTEKSGNGRLLQKRKIAAWEPDEALKEAIVKSWGLEKINERTSNS